MKRLALFLFPVLILFCALPVSADSYMLDKVHSQILFSVSHMGFSNSNGAFRSFDGKFEFDEKNMEKSSAEVTIYTSSIDMNDATWTQHLQSQQWFNVEKHPTMTFKSTGVKKTGTNTIDVMGNLTLLGETKPVTLKVTFNKVGQQQDKIKAGFSATAQINRTQFGMQTFAPAIGANVDIKIEVEGFKL